VSARTRAMALALAVALVGGPAVPALGQMVRGHLRDVRTNETIADGLVSLVRCGGERVASVLTGADGAYRLAAPAAGCFLLEARRIGYQTWIDGPVELHAGDDRETEVRLRALPVPLPPLEVAGAPPPPDAFLAGVGFYERQRSDFGHFITREQIQARAPQRVTDLLAGIPGVRVVPGTSGLDRAGIELDGSLLSHGGRCHPRVFVDGIMVIRGDARPRGLDVSGLPAATEAALPGAERPEMELDDLVQPEDIQAVEVYRRGSEVPVRFGGTSTSTQCGVVVIWTRRGRDEKP